MATTIGAAPPRDPFMETLKLLQDPSKLAAAKADLDKRKADSEAAYRKAQAAINELQEKEKTWNLDLVAREKQLEQAIADHAIRKGVLDSKAEAIRQAEQEHAQAVAAHGMAVQSHQQALLAHEEAVRSLDAREAAVAQAEAKAAETVAAAEAMNERVLNRQAAVDGKMKELSVLAKELAVL